MNKIFMRPWRLSPALRDVCDGATELPRTKVTKAVWVYIKRHELQRADDRRVVMTDARLARVCGGEPFITIFQLQKHISKHLTEVPDAKEGEGR